MGARREIGVRGVARDLADVPRVHGWMPSNVSPDQTPHVTFVAARATGPGDIPTRTVRVTLNGSAVADLLEHLPLNGRSDVLDAIRVLVPYLRGES